MPTKTIEDSPVQLTGDQMEQGSAALGGAAKGALIGAKIGTIIPGVGNLVGAGVGAAIGGLGSFFKERKAQKEEEANEKLLEDFQTSNNVINESQNQYLQNLNSLMPNQDLVSPYNMIGPKKSNMENNEKPLKQLSPYTASYSAYNMSAKQASMEPLMQKLSGASTLSPVTKFVDQTGDGKITQADVIKARTEGYEENPNND